MIETITIKTQGNSDLINITEDINKILKKSEANFGIVNIFSKHTTAGIIVIEDEEGIKKDIKENMERLFSIKNQYNHNKIQNDDNGSSHLKASIIGLDVNIPFTNSKLFLGTFQQVFLIDFDTKNRVREVAISVIEG